MRQPVTHAAPRVRRSIAAVTLATTLAVAACADPIAPGAIAEAGPHASAPRLAAEASVGRGAAISHALVPYGRSGFDASTGLAFFAGPVNPVAAAAIKCPDPSVIAPISPKVSIHQVTTPSGRVVRTAYNPEAPVALWALGAGPLTTLCQLVDAPLLATGIVQYKAEFSNCACAGSSGPGAAVVHVEASGIVNLTAGGQARLHIVVHQVVAPDGTLTRDETRVTLVPVAHGS